MGKGKVLLIVLLVWVHTAGLSQGVLQKNITLEVNNQRLDNVLEIISNAGDFYFSYNSGSVKKDSLVSLKAVNKKVQDILAQLFGDGYEFRESGNYIIIRKAPVRMTLITQKGVTEEKVYSVSGFVFNEKSGAAINQASIYEKTALSGALTNTDGFFKIRLKSSKASSAELTVSKEFYEDTTVKIQPRYNQQLTITMKPYELPGDMIVVRPGDYLVSDSVKAIPVAAMPMYIPVRRDTDIVEKKGLGKLLLSGKQKIQTVNLKRFFTTRPFQVSFTPWLGTHGKLSGQVVNNFSVNILGGYTAGTNGLELGGLFNIDKKDVRYVQAAGLFNSVGGRVDGVQLAGINNLVLDSVRGVQAAGVNNLVKGNMRGLQIAGVYNHVTDSVKGVQVAGVANFSRKKTDGVQIAGVVNISSKRMNGVQISGVVNYAKRLRGLQIGVINIADSSDGFSIGLINIVLKGYHKLSYSANELQNVNLSFKTGNRKLYSILTAGLNASDSNKLYSYGYGLGSELPLNKKRSLTINPELTSQYLYMGSWDYTNILNKLTVSLNIKLGKYVSVFAGPSFSVYISDQKSRISGYRYPVPPAGYNTMRISNRVTGWFGWSAGISFF
jgi:hypothetical protein